MNTSFQRRHAAMLLKYSGISFISGAVNHGFFSGQRSLWTAAIGMVLFVGGAWMEHRFADAGKDQPGSLARTLFWGSLLSIGLGFFTGGLQHFPDSPARSAWVVPLGFVVSVIALVASESFAIRRGVLAYSVVAGVAIAAASTGAWQWLERIPAGESAGHSHEASAHDSGGLVAQVVTRSIEVTMDDQMRFTPSTITAQPGETLRIVARNAGQVDHELVIGDEATIREHAEAMRRGGDHAHSGGAAISVKPGQVGELVVTFRQAGVLQVACLVPGHYEAGMRGTLQVGGASPATLAKPAPPAAAHGDHKH